MAIINYLLSSCIQQHIINLNSSINHKRHFFGAFDNSETEHEKKWQIKFINFFKRKILQTGHYASIANKLLNKKVAKFTVPATKTAHIHSEKHQRNFI